MTEIFLILMVILINNGDNDGQKCLLNSAGKTLAPVDLLFGIENSTF